VRGGRESCRRDEDGERESGRHGGRGVEREIDVRGEGEKDQERNERGREGKRGKERRIGQEKEGRERER